MVLRPEDVFCKKLRAGDVNDNPSLFVQSRCAQQLCPEAFEAPPGEIFIQDLGLYDANGNFLPFRFRKMANGRCYLEREWRNFIEGRNRGLGDVVRIRRQNQTIGEVLVIGFELLFGQIIG